MQPHTQRRFTLPAGLRVKRAALFQEAYAQGHKEVGKFAVLWVHRDEQAGGKLGVVASKKVGNSVARSRAKRRLREGFRLNRHRLREDVDYILVARRSILKAPAESLNQDLLKLFSRAGQLQSPGESPTGMQAK